MLHSLTGLICFILGGILLWYYQQTKDLTDNIPQRTACFWLGFMLIPLGVLLWFV